MPDESSHSAKVQVLSIWDRYRFFASQTEEPDAKLLWPGLRQVLAAKYRSPKSFVIGVVTSESRVVCRAIFTQSLTDSKVWHYGYLYTDPQHRQQGFGRQVLLTGLQIVRRLGGLYSDCYVARTNVGSIALNEKIGYRRLQFVRLHGSQKNIQQDAGLTLQELEQLDIRQSDAGRRILRGVAGAQWMDVLSEDFLCPSSPFRWKRLRTSLVCVTQNDRTIALARCGNGYANVILDHQAIPTPMLKQTCAAIGFSLSRGRRVGKSFFFVKEDELQGSPDPLDDSSYDYIYMHGHVGVS
jgi:ribosomal protein S18 acetylase RimI-like enzyme